MAKWRFDVLSYMIGMLLGGAIAHCIWIFW